MKVLMMTLSALLSTGSLARGGTADGEPRALTVQIDGQTTPIRPEQLREGASKTLEHNGHKVVVKRSGGKLLLEVDGQPLSLDGGEEGGAGSANLTCVVKVGSFSTDEAGALEQSLSAEEGSEVWVNTEGQKVALSADDVKVFVGEDGTQKVVVTARENNAGAAAGSGSAQKEVKHITVASGSSGAQTTTTGQPGDGQVVMVQKRVMVEHTDEGIQGKKVVVRCSGEPLPGQEGGGKKVIIIRKELDQQP